jgi:hypothetical protein
LAKFSANIKAKCPSTATAIKVSPQFNLIFNQTLIALISFRFNGAFALCINTCVLGFNKSVLNWTFCQLLMEKPNCAKLYIANFPGLSLAPVGQTDVLLRRSRSGGDCRIWNLLPEPNRSSIRRKTCYQVKAPLLKTCRRYRRSLFLHKLMPGCSLRGRFFEQKLRLSCRFRGRCYEQKLRVSCSFRVQFAE